MNLDFEKKKLNTTNLPRLSKFEYVKEINKLHNVHYILFKGRKFVFHSILFSFQLSCFLLHKQKTRMLEGKSCELLMQDFNM